MIDQVAPPSKNPANDNSPGGAFEFCFNKMLEKTDDMIPAKVIAYDIVKNVATIQPLIMLVDTLGQTLSQPQYANIQVFAFGGGGIGLRFPMQPNDIGWFKATDRDISLWKQSLLADIANAKNEGVQNTNRLHSFSDSMFYPDSLYHCVVASGDEDAMLLQLYNNSTKLAIHRDGKAVLKAGDSVFTMLPDGTVTGSYSTAEFTGDTTTLNSNVIINGNILNDGDISCTGTITADGDVVSGDITLKTHLTSEVQHGTGTSGVPVP